MNEFMQSTSSERLFPFMNSTVFFYIAVASFGCYACWYFDANKETDRFQRHVLASVTATSYIVSLGLGFGPMISTFCVAPRAVIVGFLVSNFAHFLVPWLQRRGRGITER
jgi:antibiotic biosynthesis monooxygenase (ABM) superfamily enzyme